MVMQLVDESVDCKSGVVARDSKELEYSLGELRAVARSAHLYVLRDIYLPGLGVGVDLQLSLGTRNFDSPSMLFQDQRSAHFISFVHRDFQEAVVQRSVLANDFTALEMNSTTR